VSDLGPEHLPELLREFEHSPWETMSIRSERLSITVSHRPAPANGAAPAPAPPPSPAPAAEAPAPAPAAVEQPPAAAEPAGEEAKGVVAVRSPVLGTFYRSPKPGAPPFVEVGSTVGADDTVAIVEVMKLMNQVAAGVAGEIVEVCASNGEMVQYDEVLFRIRPQEG
jgi:acetyl-CoA carboxylase biotin carboxyl carrier protein